MLGNNSGRPTVPERVLWPLLVVKGCFGLTVGLFLFTYPLEFFHVLRNAGLSEVDSKWWLALIFIINILLELFLEVPTGAIADARGQPFAIKASVLLRGTYFVALLVPLYLAERYALSSAAVITFLILAAAIYALHYTFQSGALVAWVKNSLDEMGHPGAMTLALARADSLYWALFIVGTLAAFFLYTWDLTYIGWLAALGVCIFSWAFTIIYMDAAVPNRRALTSLREELRSVLAIQATGARLFFANRPLLLLSILSAAATSLIYIVDLVWPIVVESRYLTSGDQRGGSTWTSWGGIAIILVFTATSLIGAHLVAMVARRPARDNFGHAQRTRWLLRLNVGLSLAFAFPVIASGVLDPMLATEARGFMPFWSFFILMAIHKLVHGALRAPGDALRNEFVAVGTKERATILSFSAVLQNSIICILVFAGVGGAADSLMPWIIPALVVVIGAVVVLLGIPVPEERKASAGVLSGAPISSPDGQR